MVHSVLLALAPLMAGSGGEIDARLAAHLASVDADAHVPAIVQMGKRYDMQALLAEVDRLPRAARRNVVMERLQAHALAEQAELLPLVREMENAGAISHSHLLWNVNAHIVTGTRDALERLAAVEGVAVVRWDTPLAPEETQDVAPPLSYEIARTPFEDGFENGAASAWELGEGARVEAGELIVPAGEEARLHMHLSAMVGVELELAVRSLAGAADWQGLSLESFGAEAVQLGVAELDSESTTIQVDVDAAIAGKRFVYTPNVSVVVSGGAGGVAVSRIGLTHTGSLAAEPNIVALQAPDLWALGVTGKDVLILNIDSGVANNHPALLRGIWNNPGEPDEDNGIDDDNNGFVDDNWGWDFGGNDNYPYDGGHGTNTAGIVMGTGEGNGDVKTGMAPKAIMAVSKISGEAAALASYQYAITIGVDCVTSSHSWKWPSAPDYHAFRDAMVAELAAGIIHANSIGNQGNSTTSYPIPFNVSAPGNVPGPWDHPDQAFETAVKGASLGCAGVLLGGDELYTSSGQGPSAWEDINNYTGWGHDQDAAYWDHPVGGFGGPQPGILKPDMCAYTNVATTNGASGYTSSFGGTSAATPHLGGALCLMIDANPAIPPRQISQALQETALDLGPPGKDLRFGAGKVQVYDAALKVLGQVTAMPHEPSLGESVDLQISGPNGRPYYLAWGLQAGSISLPLVDLDIADAQLFVNGTLTGYANPVVITIPVPNDAALSGLEVHLQLVTDDSAGAIGEWLPSLRETVTIQ